MDRLPRRLRTRRALTQCRQLSVVSTAGGTPRLLARDAIPQGPPYRGSAVSTPSSRRVVARRGPALVSIDIASGDAVVLARGDFLGWSIAPTGDKVVYSLARTLRTGDLYVVRVMGGTAKRVARNASFPVWGRDTIAFARERWLSGGSRYSVWSVKPDGRDPRRLTKGVPPGHGYVPLAWSTDGRRLLAANETEVDAPPVAIDPATGATRRVASAPFSIALDLSSNGRWILVQASSDDNTANARIEKLPYGGGRRAVIARRAVEGSWNL